MILRRFMKHVKDQNWVAVGLDVLVVITGIFLGMQVTEMNDERKNRDLERDYLERLVIDLEENIETLKGSVDFHEKIKASINETASFLMLEEWDEEAHEKIRKQMMAWGAFPVLPLQTGAWDELVSTGRLSLIQDSITRDSLQKTASELLMVRTQFDQMATVGGTWAQEFERFTSLWRSKNGEMFIRPDFKEVFGDEVFVTNLLVSASRQGRAIGLREAQITTNKKTLSLLKCQLKQSECSMER
ncbi:hypothetical protein QGN29_13260 [Temperatibacter marinus]|uniref:Uncharacterized protein n=1 Tax=Temperatibacter marinus TaxID=1456591 RepID=A0AA52EGT1_9PROT|nr:hypothetical protein [Temperatibacter marinus]WND02515.1 hypothetical protein QGN29_13260 [Temperatibacter marinus]